MRNGDFALIIAGKLVSPTFLGGATVGATLELSKFAESIMKQEDPIKRAIMFAALAAPDGSMDETVQFLRELAFEIGRFAMEVEEGKIPIRGQEELEPV